MVFHFWNVTIPYMYMYQFHNRSISVPYLFCTSSPVPLSELYFDSFPYPVAPIVSNARGIV